MHVWFDISAGVAGDMLLGALVDAGADLGRIQEAIDAVLPGSIKLVSNSVRRAGIRATKIDVEILVPDQQHRHWSDIRNLLHGSSLHPVVLADAERVFELLAAAEAHAHGVDISDVHFHEVGALDSIADVVGVCAALFDLGVTSASASVLAVGSGRVRTEHGEMSVPVPAVTELISGWRLQNMPEGVGELATPTGVALIRALTDACEPLSVAEAKVNGVGAGTKEFSGWANVVRVVLGDSQSVSQEVFELRANVDDLDPRLWPGVLDEMMAAGAHDVWLTPIVMKKGRPAQMVSALVDESVRHAVADVLFRTTPTFGVRWTPVERAVLDRRFETVSIRGQSISVKIGERHGRFVTAAPEFEDVAAAARALGTSQREVLGAALQQFYDGH